jgi:hypothetical protein
MAEKIKEFLHLDSQSTEGDITLVTTTATTQAVVKDITFKGKSTHYPTELTVKLNGKEVGETYTSAAGVELSVALSGNQIVDVSSTLDVNLPPITTLTDVGKLDAIVFSNGVNMRYKDENPALVGITDTYTNLDVVANLNTDFEYTTSQNSANSAFAVIRNSEVQYFRFYNNILYRHSGTSTSVETAITVPESSHSMCTDGTYFYEKSLSTSTTIRVYNVSDYAQQTSITTDVTFRGQDGNQGSFMLTHGGYIYTKYNGPATTVYKTEISTGTTTTIATTSVGSYGAGAVITRGSDGVFYLVEKGSGGWYKVNLTTEAVTFSSDNGGRTESTEYGNAAFEISGGYVGVLDAQYILIIDVVAGTYALYNTSSELAGWDFPNGHTYGTECAVAALSISQNLVERPKDLNYSIYAAGVEITGV